MKSGTVYISPPFRGHLPQHDRFPKPISVALPFSTLSTKDRLIDENSQILASLRHPFHSHGGMSIDIRFALRAEELVIVWLENAKHVRGEFP